MSDAIRLVGLKFFTLVGDLPHERRHPQPIRVDVEVSTDTRPAGASDRLEDGLDYRRVYAAVSGAVSHDPERAPRLLENLCERMATAVLDLERVTAVRVKVGKPWAALAGPAEAVEVEIARP